MSDLCVCGIPKERHADPLWVTVHERDGARTDGTMIGRGERARR